MARRGRPKGADSAETRLRIINAARIEFAGRGFDGASIALIASAADLAPSAVYHYFGGKAALYEEVLALTTEAIWADVEAVSSGSDTLLGNVEAIVEYTRKLSRERRTFSNFLALFPMESTLHPEFTHMLDWRNKHLEKTFTTLAEQGLATGELAGFDLVTATELMRSLIMGWWHETYIHGPGHSHSGDFLMILIRRLAEGQPSTS